MLTRCSQLLVALRLLDLVNIGRGIKARLFKRRVRIVTLVVFLIVNVPSLIGCWIAAHLYRCPHLSTKPPNAIATLTQSGALSRCTADTY